MPFPLALREEGSCLEASEGGPVFAEDYPRFMEVSELIPKPERMNERYEALFTSNRDIFDGLGCSISPATTGDIRSRR
jgi:hypothetical protein